ncbi:MAG: Rpn family recombination-promoting nuclease/putative transposase [bacterium]|nr:Rpn family recombination-promoting nuclease/putative transposase [bacterium]
MGNKRKLVTFDWAIKTILRNKASFGILEGFLSELLHDDIKISKVLESESNQENTHSRSNRVDLLVEDSKKELIIVEVQHDSEFDYLQRILFGVSKVLVEHIKQGEIYGKIRKVVSVSIVYFDLGQGADYAYKGRTEFIGLNQKDVLKLNSQQQEAYKTEEIGDIYPEYYILKINNFDDVARNTVDEWIYFLKNEEIKDDFTARGLKEAKTELDILKLSDEERREYEYYLEGLRYEASMYHSHYKVGESNGKEEGIKEGTLNMARALKANGVSIETIINASGLSREEVQAL